MFGVKWVNPNSFIVVYILRPFKITSIGASLLKLGFKLLANGLSTAVKTWVH
jgi:hypothetical protein